MGRLKKKNSFKFESFARKIEKVGGDAVKWSAKLAGSVVETESFLLEAITKWNDLDFGQDYQDFLSEVPLSDLQTCAQVLYYQDVVVNALIKHLTREKSQSVIAIVEITMGAVRDYRDSLKEDDVFRVLDALVHCALRCPEVSRSSENDASVLEVNFLAITLTLKTFANVFVNDLKAIYKKLLPLLSSRFTPLRRLCSESFAFVLRKASSIEKFSSFLVRQCGDDPRLSDGVSSTLTHVLRGTNNRLHSAADRKLNQILNGLLTESCREQGTSILKKIVENLATYCNTKDFARIVLILISFLPNDPSPSWISSLYSLISHSLSSSCTLRRDPSPIADQLFAALSSSLQDKESFECMQEFFVPLILNVFHTREFSDRVRPLMDSLFDWIDIEKGMNLLKETMDLPQFDDQFMPLLGKLAEREMQNGGMSDGLLEVYADICDARRPVCSLPTTDSRSGWFDLSFHSSVRDDIRRRLFSLSTANRETVINLAVVLPWIFEQNEPPPGSKELLSLLKKTMAEGEDGDLAFVLSSVLFLLDRFSLREVSLNEVLAFIGKCSSSSSSVRALHLFLLSRDQWDSLDDLLSILDSLDSSFLNPHSVVRRAILDSLSRFRFQFDDLEQDESVFEILLSAENEHLDLEGYRRRIAYLNKLSHPYHKRFFPSGYAEKMQHIALRLILSHLFEHFTPLFEPVLDIVKTYADGIEGDEFWNVIEDALRVAEQGINTSSESTAVSTCRFLEKDVENINYFSFRLELFKLFARIPDKCEKKTKLLSPILLSLYHTDFLDEQSEKDDGEEEEEEGENGQETTVKVLKKKKEKKKSKMTGKEAMKSIATLLETYAQFTRPRSVFREKEVMSMYYELLLFSNLQQVVLRCIFTYKIKGLNQYRENLERLTGEKTVRDELVKFSVDEQTSPLEDKHRHIVIPIFIRILLGHFRSHSKWIGKWSLLGAVAGCRPDELSIFISILFAPVMPLLGNTEEDPRLEKAREQLQSNINNISLPRLTWAVRTTNEVLSRLSTALLEHEQKTLLRLLFVSYLLLNLARHHLPPKALKKVRQGLCEAIRNFFHAFPDRPLSSDELFLLDSNVLLAEATKVSSSDNSEGSFRLPLSSLKLIQTWTELPQWHCLLNHRLSLDGVDCSPLQLFFSTVTHQLNKKIVTDCARKIISNLLTMADEDMIMPDIDQLPLELKKDVNRGTSLLAQQLPLVLSFLHASIERVDRANHSTDLEILARLAPYVQETHDRTRFTHILIQKISSNHRHSHLPIVLSALSSFAPSIEDPDQALKYLIPLFSIVEGRTNREHLTEVLRGLSRNPLLPDQSKRILRFAADLDAWDGSKIDEVHYDKRSKAIQGIEKECTGTSPINVNIICILVHTIAYSMKHVDDLSLRALTTDAFISLIRYISRVDHPGDVVYKIVDGHITTQIFSGFAQKDQAIRDNFIRAFSVLVDVFPDHPRVGPLKELKNKDEEVDFFENIIHIQIHRRQRAIKRITDGIEKGTICIPVESLHKYIFPLIQPWFIFSSTKMASLSDESLAFFKCVLARTEWKKYLLRLQHWLKILQTTNEQKAVVRVIVSILDAFHFDCEDPEVKHTVVNVLLPALKKGKEVTIVQRKGGSAREVREDEDIKRTPVILATVKLLQKLPQEMMDEHLHGILLKLIGLIGAHSQSVREVARKTLLEVANALGPRYLPFLVKELKQSLVHGFQVHVMLFTVHSLLSSMSSSLPVGSVDSCIDDVVSACCADLFGSVADEKEIGAIRDATMEAKQDKATDTMHLMARFVSASSLGRLLRPLQDILEELHSAKTHKAVGRVLKEVAIGLRRNEGIDHKELLVFIHQTITENLEKLKNTEEEENRDNETVQKKPESCYLLPSAPKRVGVLEQSKKTHAPVILEFGVTLFAAILGAHSWKDEGDAERLDPFVHLLLSTLSVSYDKVVACALRCFHSLHMLSLPSIPRTLHAFTNRLFVLLHNYAGIGNGKTSTLHLNQLIFKSLAQVIRLSDENVLVGDKAEVLLSFVLTDVLDPQKQATAFVLMKSIIAKKVQHEHVREIMKHIREMNIQSELSHVRTQCRQLVVSFVGNHPFGMDAQSYLEFYLAQLRYGMEDGRIAAMETLDALANSLLPAALDEMCLRSVSQLATCLVNEESPRAKKMAAITLTRILSAASDARRSDVIGAIGDWVKAKKDPIRAAGALVYTQMCRLPMLTEHDGQSLRELLPYLTKALSDTEKCSTRTAIAIFHAIAALIVLHPSGIDTDSALADAFEVIGKWSKAEHKEVHLPAATLLGNLLSLGPIHTLPSKATLFEWSAWLLASKGEVSPEVTKQVMKNIVLEVDGMNKEEITAVCKKLASICKYEIVKEPENVTKRQNCFKLCAAIVLKTEGEAVDVVVDAFLPFILREMNGKSADRHGDTLSSLAMEVLEVIKKKIGEKEVAGRLASCQEAAREKEAKRKADRKRKAVLDPVGAAKARSEKHKKKRITKKRKLDKKNPNRIFKRARVTEELTL